MRKEFVENKTAKEISCKLMCRNVTENALTAGNF